ncbi:MAG: pyridoxine 5'-phosphate synthase [Bdellovibrionota bacterium]
MRPKLSVNVNKVATLRNARGGTIPNLLEFASQVEACGGQGITVHPRPDQRHIRYQDVHDLSQRVTTEFNIEGYPSPAFLQLVEQVKPTQVTLVPDGPNALTSNAGWDLRKHQIFLTGIVRRLQSQGMRVSLFVEPSSAIMEYAKSTGADRIELYTENYAKTYGESAELAIEPYVKAALAAKELNLGINAGHDLNLENLRYFASHLPGLLEVSIGHALIADCLYEGLQTVLKKYLSCLS